MHNLANVYICPTDGEITDAYYHEHIDTENDEIYPVMCCGKCNREVRQKTEHGLPVYAEVEVNFFDDGYEEADEHDLY